MASRIHTHLVSDEFGKDYQFPYEGRQAKMGEGFKNRSVFAYKVIHNEQDIEPIIAKGNIFEGIEAKW